MSDLWSDLLQRLHLSAADGAGTLTGDNQNLEYHRVFGGQILGQFIAAQRDHSGASKRSAAE